MRSNEQVRIAPGNPQSCRGHDGLFIGGGKSSNNRGDPTLEEHERARGRSGEAIQGEKKVAGAPDRQSARKRQSS
ncbi:MAG: hypothetical protein QOH81_221 [Sphingomonadales bacterium]|jgi:hypothetical protein|nr:hypothetical protein [Sphingomonadales bacterium]